jgi:hypothetical protein
MNLQVLVALAEIVSASAVTLTLIALIISIRQNTRSQKALAVDSLAAAITSINVPAMQSHLLGSALSKATSDWSSASREERIIAHFSLFSFFKLLENAWYQQKRSFLTRHSGSDGRGCCESIIMPGLSSRASAFRRPRCCRDGVRRVWWPCRRHAYSPEFQKFLSGTRSPDELGSLDDLFDFVQQ